MKYLNLVRVHIESVQSNSRLEKKLMLFMMTVKNENKTNKHNTLSQC